MLSALARAINFLRIGNIGRRDLVHHVGGRVAQHPLGADIEDLNDALGVGGDAREIGAVENRSLQGPRLEQRLFRLLARGVVGADQQIADDGVLRVAQRRDRHHRRKPAAILADVGQLVDVLDPARGLEHQSLEARRDRGAKFGAQLLGARDHFLRIGNIGRRDLVHHFGGRIAQHALGADIEDLNDALGVGGDAREIGAVENRALQGPGLEQSLFRQLARGIVGADQQVADDDVLRVAQRRDRHHCREPAAILADIGQLVDVLDPARGLEHQGLEARRDRGSKFDAQLFGARDQFLGSEISAGVILFITSAAA